MFQQKVAIMYISVAPESRKCISDGVWFRKTPNRNFRVRPATETDHVNFYRDGDSPAGCWTIIKSDQRQRLVVVPMAERFGDVIDTDMYAIGRIGVMRDARRRNRLLADLKPLQATATLFKQRGLRCG
jgi:hypothetical protein